jgi:predicted DCC family thiol-disulfide oxidoreductase YuxK
VDDLIVLYDRDCGFCSVMVAVLLTWDRANNIRPLPIQSAPAEKLLIDLAPQDRLKAWHLIDLRGMLYSGGAGIPVILNALPWGAPIARVASQFPNATSRAYEWVANQRVLLGRPLKARPRAWAVRVIAERERLRMQEAGEKG